MRAEPARLSAGQVLTGLAALLVAGSILVPVAALAMRAGGATLGAADAGILRFTLVQAALSALISVGFALPLARALARRQFPGRGALIALFGAPFLLPTIVAALALIAVFGRDGWLNAGLALVGLPGMSVYGPAGVVLAHVFLNLPLATRMLLLGWQAIPSERFRLAEALGLGAAGMFRHLELPMLARVAPGALALVFAVCLTSFAVALMLGGGPQATTVELAIYQALRFDFDLAHATGLALVQLGLGAGAALLAFRVADAAGVGRALDRKAEIRGPHGLAAGIDAAVIVAGAAFLLLPLLHVLARGLAGLPELPAAVWPALARSLVVALVSAALAVGLAFALAQAVASRSAASAALDLLAGVPLALSGLALGTGLFLTLRPIAAPETLALGVTIWVNALLALPFAYRLMLPVLRATEADFGPLAGALGLVGWARLRWLVLPRARRNLGFAAGIAAALAMGDLGVIALFASGEAATLPLVVQRLAGAYRTDAAAAAALLLVGATFAVFLLCDLWGRHAEA